MEVGKCYQFKFYRPNGKYKLLSHKNKLYNSKGSKGATFKVVAGLSGKKNTVSLRLKTGKHIGMKKNG